MIDTTAPPTTVTDLVDALDWEIVRCHACGAVIGESAISGGHARFKCRACKRWTVWPWKARGASAERAAARRRATGGEDDAL